MIFPAPPPQSEAELLTRAHTLAGLTFAQLAEHSGQKLPLHPQHAKGWTGQLLEGFLGATAASLPEPDFQQIGVELKTLPVNPAGHPKESTYVCTVPLRDNLNLKWETSWVRHKLGRVLWVPVEGEKDIPFAQRRIGMAILWSPDQHQEALLRQDWEELMDMICLGKLEEISAHHGQVLQIRPKAAHSRILSQSNGTDGAPTQTLPRGFYLRAQFTRDILHQNYAL